MLYQFKFAYDKVDFIWRSLLVQIIRERACKKTEFMKQFPFGKSKVRK
jgi:hypothetical protein